MVRLFKGNLFECMTCCLDSNMVKVSSKTIAIDFPVRYRVKCIWLQSLLACYLAFH